MLLGVLEDLSRPYLRFFLFHELQQPLNRRSHTVSVILNISNLKIDSLLFLSAGKWSELLFHFLSLRAGNFVAAEWLRCAEWSGDFHIQYLSSGSFIPLSINSGRMYRVMKWLLLLRPAPVYCQLLCRRLNYNCHALSWKISTFINTISPSVSMCGRIPDANSLLESLELV